MTVGWESGAAAAGHRPGRPCGTRAACSRHPRTSGSVLGPSPATCENAFVDLPPAPAPNSPATDSVTGLIERVTYFNEETGFCVLRVKAGGHQDLVTVVGSLSSVNAGEWITAQGVWVRDKEHGLQLKATTLNTIPPTTAEGIERYLGSGMVKGVGPVFAKRLVERFGAEVLAVIEHRPEDLQSVEGIGPNRERRIVEPSLGWFGSDSEVYCRSRER